MEEWGRRCWAQVDLGRIRRNYQKLKGLLAPGQKYLAVVKANAYGHGAVPVAAALEAEGADWFGVAALEEGEELRRGGVRRPILILGYTPPHLVPRIAGADLTQGVFSLPYARALQEAAEECGCRVSCHLMVDSGMSRLGLSPRDPASLLEAEQIFACKNLVLGGVFTHFAVSDELSEESLGFTREQYRVFQDFCGRLRERGLEPGISHCANSAAALLHQEMRLGMCRFGIVSYGLMPSEEVVNTLGLEPAMSLYATVAMVKTVEEGDTVSYGRCYTASEKRVIATVAIGYADGLPRSLGCGGRVLVRGEYAPIAGRICMDQLMADVTGIPGVRPGDTVTLVGEDGKNRITWDEVAKKTGSISYERVCGVASRVPRIYQG